MAANPRQILRNLMFSLDGQLLSTGTNNFDVTLSREKLPYAAFDSRGTFNAKGSYIAGMRLVDSFGTASDAKLLEALAEDDDLVDFLLLLRSNTRNSPMDTPGNPALFMAGHVFEVPTTRAEEGQIKRIGATFEPSDGRAPHLGQTLYTSRAATAAPMTEGVVITDPVNLGSLVEGYELAVTVHCHSITGTGIVAVQVELLSDALVGFGSPISRHTFDLEFTNEDPVPVGGVAAPKAQTIVLDGDTLTISGEPWWALRITITDDSAGTDGEVELTGAAALVAK